MSSARSRMRSWSTWSGAIGRLSRGRLRRGMGSIWGRGENRGREENELTKLFSRSQVRERSIDWLKRKLRTRLDDYPVPINDITSDNKFFRGVLWDSPPKTTDQ